MNPLAVKPKTDKRRKMYMNNSPMKKQGGVFPSAPPPDHVDGRPRQWGYPDASGKRKLNPKWKKYMNEIPVAKPRRPPRMSGEYGKIPPTNPNQGGVKRPPMAKMPTHVPKLNPQQKKIPWDLNKRKKRPTLITI